jgi:hypothetical protein
MKQASTLGILFSKPLLHTFIIYIIILIIYIGCNFFVSCLYFSSFLLMMMKLKIFIINSSHAKFEIEMMGLQNSDDGEKEFPSKLKI